MCTGVQLQIHMIGKQDWQLLECWSCIANLEKE